LDCSDLIDEICAPGIVKPDQECLHNACSRVFHKKNIKKLYNYKLFADEQCFLHVVNLQHQGFLTTNFDENIKFLADHGFSPTLQHVAHALKHSLVIKSLDTYGISYNADLYKICFDTGVFPPEYIENMVAEKELIRLRNMFLTFSETVLRKYLAENPTITIDQYCFCNALKNKNNLMALIVEHGYNPSLRDIIVIKDEEKRLTLFGILYEKPNRFVIKS